MEILNKEEAHYVHIRKPSASILEIEQLLKNINPVFHPRLKLHDHFELIEKYNIGGIHLNFRNPFPYPGVKKISASIHELDEIDRMNNYEYFFISPIFDSISKPGYNARFDLNELSKSIKGRNAIALGGVTPNKLPLLKSCSFFGAAMLGYFFPTHCK